MSVLSHGFILGTILRALYLLLWGIGFILCIEYIINYDILSNIAWSENYYLIIIVWCIQDLTHILLDMGGKLKWK